MEPVILLQTKLKKFDPEMAIDGNVGGQTLGALASLSLVDRIWLDFELEQEIGMASKAIVGERGFKTPEYQYLRKSDCDSLIKRACRALGVEQYAAVYCDFMYREAGKRRIGGEICYNVLSRSGNSANSARGLNQFQPPAWVDARSKALQMNSKYDIGDYKEGVYFPANNIIACIAYSQLAIKLMVETYNIPVNGETMYLAHNQGPYFWEDFSTTNFSGQSKEAQLLITKYKRLYG